MHPCRNKTIKTFNCPMKINTIPSRDDNYQTYQTVIFTKRNVKAYPYA